MKTGKRFGIIAIVLAASFGAAIIVGKHFGLRINITDSAPAGFWYVDQAISNFKRGEFVEACPPVLPVVKVMGDRGYLEAGDCLGTGVMPLLKPVAAVAGDVVELKTGEMVKVNGNKLLNTQAMDAVPAWKEGVYTVKDGQVWLFSTYSAGSFDSRYFGPVSLEGVRGKAVPFLIAGNVDDMTIMEVMQ